MKSAWREVRQESSEFKSHFLQYVLLFLSLDLLNEIVLLPLFRYLTTFILQAGSIPFVSYQNLLWLLTHRVGVVISLIVELVALILVIYFEFAFLLIGIQSVRRSDFKLKRVLYQSVASLRHLSLGSILLLIAYLIFIVPFADIIFRTPLLAKIQIPDFIIDYMTRNWILAIILFIFYLGVGILGLRLVFTLPIMILAKKKTGAAMKKSWRLSRRLWRQLLLRLLLVMAIAIIILFGFYCSFYLVQLEADIFPRKLSFILAVINLTLIQLISEVVFIWATLLAVSFLFNGLSLKRGATFRKRSLKVKKASAAVILILLMMAVFENCVYLQFMPKRPLIISHRGVSENNGVQNTILALEKTAQLKPDYVEIDLHESSDGQFVVMHDENLQKLAHVDRRPHDLSLEKLTKLKVHENGKVAQIASFNQYLKAARRLHQKLLIEIKTTPDDSKGMLETFNKKYGATILKNHYLVQSLDYRVVENLHRINPKLPVYYIQPYNFAYPQSVASGYAMEYSTLNANFIWQAHLNHQLVYAWTVNKPDLVKKLMNDHVDGIITDNVPAVKQAIEDFQDNRTYANRILNYSFILPILLANARF